MEAADSYEILITTYITSHNPADQNPNHKCILISNKSSFTEITKHFSFHHLKTKVQTKSIRYIPSISVIFRGLLQITLVLGSVGKALDSLTDKLKKNLLLHIQS
jgi:hypothetical protein